MFTGGKTVPKWEPLVYCHTQPILEFLSKHNCFYYIWPHFYFPKFFKNYVQKSLTLECKIKRNCSYEIVTLNKDSFVISRHRVLYFRLRWGGRRLGQDVQESSCLRLVLTDTCILLPKPHQEKWTCYFHWKYVHRQSFAQYIHHMHAPSLKRAPASASYLLTTENSIHTGLGNKGNLWVKVRESPAEWMLSREAHLGSSSGALPLMLSASSSPWASCSSNWLLHSGTMATEVLV